MMNLVAFTILRNNDFEQRAMERLGLLENGKEKKLTFSHTSVNKLGGMGVDHHLSPHTMELQRSKYICVNNDLSKRGLLGSNSNQFIRSSTQTKALSNYDYESLRIVGISPPSSRFNSNVLELSLRYCPG